MPKHKIIIIIFKKISKNNNNIKKHFTHFETLYENIKIYFSYKSSLYYIYTDKIKKNTNIIFIFHFFYFQALYSQFFYFLSLVLF